MYIEFVGDSITVGNGNLIPNGQGKGELEYMDATQSYGYLTAKSLGADYSLVAISGIGASVGWTSYNMQTVYPKLRYPKDSSTNYNFARKPDVVVLALGTNDYQCRQTYGKTWDDIKAGFASMLNLVRQKNPSAKVVWIHGMMTTEVGYLIEEVIQEAGGTANGLYTLQLDKNNAGGNGHPLASAHKQYAKDLTEKIQSLFPKPTTTSKTTTTTTTKTTTSKLTTKTTTTPTTTKTTTTTPKITTKKTTKTTTTVPEITTKKTTGKTTTKRTRKTFTLAPKTTTEKTTEATAISPGITTKTTEKQTAVNEVINPTADGEETLKTTTIASDADATDTNEDFPVVDSTTIDDEDGSLITEGESVDVTEGTDDDETIADETLPADGTPEENAPKNNVIAKVIAIVAVAVAALGGGAFFIFKKRKNK